LKTGIDLSAGAAVLCQIGIDSFHHGIIQDKLPGPGAMDKKELMRAITQEEKGIKDLVQKTMTHTQKLWQEKNETH